MPFNSRKGATVRSTGKNVRGDIRQRRVRDARQTGGLGVTYRKARARPPVGAKRPP